MVIELRVLNEDDWPEPGDLLRDGVGRKQVLAKILRGGVGYRH